MNTPHGCDNKAWDRWNQHSGCMVPFWRFFHNIPDQPWTILIHPYSWSLLIILNQPRSFLIILITLDPSWSILGSTNHSLLFWPVLVILDQSKRVLIILDWSWSVLTNSHYSWPFLTSPDHFWQVLIIPKHYWSFLTSQDPPWSFLTRPHYSWLDLTIPYPSWSFPPHTQCLFLQIQIIPDHSRILLIILDQ